MVKITQSTICQGFPTRIGSPSRANNVLNELIIKPLNEDDVGAIQVFECDEKELTDWLKTDALRDQALMISRTFLVKHPKNGALGYFSLLNDSIRLDPELKGKWKRREIEYSSLPALKIGRLATHKNHIKKGIGKAMLANILKETLKNITPRSGCRYITVDSLPNAIGWYKKLDFEELKTKTKRKLSVPMYFDLERIAQVAS